MTAITLNFKSLITLTDEVFAQLCRSNPEMRLERTASGELIAMAPAGSESGYYNLHLSAQLWLWNEQTQAGVAFDSSAGFTLPNGAIRSPDAAWIRQERWDQLTPEQKRQFAPVCPDFVLELLSPSDSLTMIQAKLIEYLANGAQLGWLVDPGRQQVIIYRLGQAVELLNQPEMIFGEAVLPGFTLRLNSLWDR